MKHLTKLKLKVVHVVCDEEDKSTEFMIQFMQDTCNVNHDTVMNYLGLDNKEHLELSKELDAIFGTLEKCLDYFGSR